jgi:hypothetical protein
MSQPEILHRFENPCLTQPLHLINVTPGRRGLFVWFQGGASRTLNLIQRDALLIRQQASAKVGSPARSLLVLTCSHLHAPPAIAPLPGQTQNNSTYPSQPWWRCCEVWSLHRLNLVSIPRQLRR